MCAEKRNLAITGDRLGNMQSVENLLDFATLELGLDTVLKQSLAGGILDFHDTILSQRAHAHHLCLSWHAMRRHNKIHKKKQTVPSSIMP